MNLPNAYGDILLCALSSLIPLIPSILTSVGFNYSKLLLGYVSSITVIESTVQVLPFPFHLSPFIAKMIN
jgi:hypothetical protein